MFAMEKCSYWNKKCLKTKFIDIEMFTARNFFDWFRLQKYQKKCWLMFDVKLMSVDSQKIFWFFSLESFYLISRIFFWLCSPVRIINDLLSKPFVDYPTNYPCIPADFCSDVCTDVQKGKKIEHENIPKMLQFSHYPIWTF